MHSVRPYPDETGSFLNTWVGSGKGSASVAADKFVTKDVLKTHLTQNNTELRRRPEYGLTESCFAIWWGTEEVAKYENESGGPGKEMHELLQTAKGAEFVEACKLLCGSDKQDLSSPEIQGALLQMQNFLRTHGEAFDKLCGSLARHHAAMSVFALNGLDLSVAFANLKRWASHVPAEGYTGDALAPWLSAPDSVPTFAAFFSEALAAKRAKLTSSGEPIRQVDKFSDEESRDAKKAKEPKKKRKDKMFTANYKKFVQQI